MVKATPLNVEDAVQILEILGASQDSIWYQNMLMTPVDLAIQVPLMNAAKLRILYHGIQSEGTRRTQGSLYDMIRDRLGVKREDRRKA